jgi:hypothetical protein
VLLADMYELFLFFTGISENITGLRTGSCSTTSQRVSLLIYRVVILITGIYNYIS